MIQIKPVKHSDRKEELLELFRSSFNQNISAAHWEWKYLHNPLTSEEVEVVVALDDGIVVGARPFMIAEMWLGKEKVMAAQHCDTMVHPDYRGKGIFNNMGRVAIDQLKANGYTLSYGFPGPMSRQGFLRQGWKIVAPTEINFRVLDPRELISRKLGNRLLGTGLGFFYNKLLNTILDQPLLPSSSFKVRLFDQFVDELTEVDGFRDDSRIDLVRSESYLRWRFDSHPEHKYKYVLANKNRKLRGYAVVVTKEVGDDLLYGYIVDYLIEDNDVACFRALIGRCLEEFKQSGCAAALIWAFNEPQLKQELVRHFGFKSASKFPYTRFIGPGYLDALHLNDQAVSSIDIYDQENWRVTLAFVDTS